MRVRLGDYIEEYSVRNIKQDEIPVYSVTNTQGFCGDYFSKDVASKNKSTYKIVPHGYFAYNPSRVNVGSIDWLREADRVIVSPLYVVFSVSDAIDQQYLLYYLKSDIALHLIRERASGSVRDNLKFSILSEFPIILRDKEAQLRIVKTLDLLENLIRINKAKLGKLDDLVKSRFVEMFGDFQDNPLGWPELGFDEFATIDTHMTTDYEYYAHYPHIGIDSIVSGTGELKGYRTVAEDNVISGKYPFTAEHIIYSKIRPNLNKVALPDFEGVCSADAYPILPKKEVCNRVFLAHVMRSDFFLNQILGFSTRSNMPKVNKSQLAHFRTPMPPLGMQLAFADFISQVDKSRSAVQKSVERLELLRSSLMQEYFG